MHIMHIMHILQICRFADVDYAGDKFVFQIYIWNIFEMYLFDFIAAQLQLLPVFSDYYRKFPILPNFQYCQNCWYFKYCQYSDCGQYWQNCQYCHNYQSCQNCQNYQNCQNCQNHNIANITNIVKMTKLDKINKIHKCALNSTNVYQIPLMCTKIPLSLTSSSVIDWNTSIVKIAEITKIINHELGFRTFVKGGILLGYMVGNKCGKVKDAITTDDCKSVLFYLIHTRIIWSPVYLSYVISKKWSKWFHFGIEIELC